jgi:hypothetical protein
MPSGRIMEEMVAPESAKIIMETFNGCTSPDSIHTERLMAISYEEIFAANKKLMKRREKFLKKKRKAGRKGGAA